VLFPLKAELIVNAKKKKDSRLFSPRSSVYESACVKKNRDFFVLFFLCSLLKFSSLPCHSSYPSLPAPSDSAGSRLHDEHTPVEGKRRRGNKREVGEAAGGKSGGQQTPPPAKRP
jgi:hypothetical protein